MSDIAIIGMACLFPGAPDLESFWRNVCAGVDAISDVPAARWDPVFYDPAATTADRLYCKRGGFVDEYARFDPARHGIMPVAARSIEPDQLLTLELATQALADAGYADRPFAREKTGVIIGRGNYNGAGRTRFVDHVRGAEQLVTALRGLLPSLGAAELAAVKAEIQAHFKDVGPDAAIGLVPNLTASRVANRLDLRGPALTVDAACASALIAVDHAAAELESGRCDLVLAGAVHLSQDESFWSVFCQLGALSRRQQIRPFDRRADGILIGEGIGVLALKRRADAERDGDRVYAVIRGTGVASDGRSATIMSPSADGQVLALERAWRAAGIDPASVGLIEAHGTGTPAGDAAEIETLRRVFGAADGHGARAGLGSVKSMIGHAMPAAGAAGLIKAALAVHHGVLPPTLHCEEPHEALAATRFRPIATREPWDAPVRRAGVNAFGFGGINAHVVLEGVAAPKRARPAPEPRLLVAAAATPAELLAVVPASAPDSLTQIGAGPCRLAVLDPTAERLARARTLVEKGRPWTGHDGIWFSPRGLLAAGGKLAFAFPGLDSAFQPRVDDLAARFGLPVPAGVDARSIEETGAGIIGVNRLLDRVLRTCGVAPDVVLGHSIGEWSGMIAAGMVPEAVVHGLLAKAQGGALELPGVFFVAAGCGREVAEAALAGLPEIALSHDNCPHQIILCGVEASVDVAMARLRERGVLAQKLPFKSGFHTPLFAGHVGVHREHFATIELAPATLPLWSATTCAPYPDEVAAVRELAVEHLLSPVRFRELIERLYDAGVRVFVQPGTGSLIQFIDDTLRGRPYTAIPANVAQKGGVEQLRRALAALWVEGAAVDLGKLWPARGATMALALGVPMARIAKPLALQAPAAPAAGSGPLAAAFADTMQAVARAGAEVLAGLERRPTARTSTRTLSVATLPELVDHTFFRQPPGWPEIADWHPVVPMTTLIQLMIEEASPLAPGRVAVAVEEVRAFRWLAVSTPVAAVFRARAEGDRVKVEIQGYAEATVVFAAAYAPPPPADTAPLANERPAPVAAERIYEDRWLFHGPRYQGIVALGPIGDDGLRGVLETGAAKGALLDNVGQVFGHWIQVVNEVDRLAMPVTLSRLRFFGPHPTAGERLDCVVRIRRHEARSVVADLSLARAGQVWCTIESWEDRRFETDPRLWAMIWYPEDKLLAEPRPGGWIWFADHYRGAPTREQLERRFLGVRERAAYEAQTPRTQRAWLSGRIAAKDAVRDHLWRNGHGPLYPIEIELDADLRVSCAAAPDLRVAVAGKGEVAVALAASGRAPGIAVEAVEPRDPTGFTAEELALVAASDDRDEWLTRILAAKQAAGQARGDGARRPGVADRTGERLLVDGLWVDTRREGGHIVAWTLA